MSTAPAPPLDYPTFNAAVLALADRGQRNQRELAAAHEVMASAERDYRHARARAWEHAEGTVPEREAQVDAMSADARHARDMARGRVEVAKSAQRNVGEERMSLSTLARWAMQLEQAGGA